MKIKMPELHSNINDLPGISDDRILDALFPSGEPNSEDKLIRRIYLDILNNGDKDAVFPNTNEGIKEVRRILEILVSDGCEGNVLKERVERFVSMSGLQRARLIQLIEQNKIDSQNIGLFMALEFGDEFGDILLDVADKITPQNLDVLSWEIMSVRMSSAAIGRFYDENVYEGLGVAIESGLNKRITEILALIKRIAYGNQLFVHNRGTDKIEEVELSLEQAILSLKAVSTSLKILADSLRGNFKVKQVVHSQRDFRGQLESDNGSVKSTLRPYVTKAGEARISWDVLDDAGQKLTIRLDLDTRLDAKGQLSLDIGSINNGVHNKEISYFLSLAEAAFAQEQGKDIRSLNGYHVREAFSHINASPEQFASWVNRYLYALSISS